MKDVTEEVLRSPMLVKGLLSYSEIVALLEAGVVCGADKARVNGSSLDITLGNKILYEYRPPINRDTVIDLRARQPLAMAPSNIKGGFYTLKPGEFILASSAEIFHLPLDISCEFKLKSSLARIGINQLTACWCLREDTGIPLLDGSVVALADLVSKKPWLYSLNAEGDFVPGHASRVWQSGYTDTLTRIVLDNEQEFYCTPNHELMRRTGSYLQAAHAEAGLALMPFQRKYDECNHEFIYNPSTVFKSNWKSLVGHWGKTHRLVDNFFNGQLPEGYDVHHSKHPRNNDPEFLERLTHGQHAAHHGGVNNKLPWRRELASAVISKRNEQNWKNEDYRKRMTERNRRNAAFTNNKRWGTEIPTQYLNHKIKCVETVKCKRTAVYDITVPRWHNFAIEAGVFVHNCDPGWNNSVMTLELQNVTRYHSIILRPGDPIGQVVFFRHSPVPEKAGYHKRGRYNNDAVVSGIKK